jgi:hypothetical protein
MFVGFIVVLILGACVREPGEYPPSKLAPSNVVAAATEFLKNMEVDVAEYRLEMLGFNYAKRTWHLQYEGNSGVLHDYYWLVIEDDNIDQISLSGR